MRMSLVSTICGAAFVWSTAVIGQEVKGEFSSPKTDEEMIANALSAAPESIAKNATVIALRCEWKGADTSERHEQFHLHSRRSDQSS